MQKTAKRLLWLWCVGCLSMGATPDTNTTIVIEADEWCPINCNPDSGKLGIGVDLAKKIFESQGYRISYRIVPWTRALQDVRGGQADAVIGANRQDDAGLIFPSSALMQMTDDFYVLQGNPWRYQGPHTLKGRRIGVVSGYGYGEIVTRFIEENRATLGKIVAASGAKAQAENVTRLKDGKIDVMVESRAVMDYMLRNNNMQGDILWAGGVPQSPVYLAFAPSNPRSAQLRKIFDDGIARLQKSGELEAIYRNYGVRP